MCMQLMTQMIGLYLMTDDPRHIHWTSIDPPDSVPLDDRTQDDLPRAQMDDGAQVICTNDRTLLYNYRAYGPSFPCPIRLKPAVKNAAVHPEGEGFIRVPAPGPVRYYDFKSHFSPFLDATLLSENTLHTGLGVKRSDFSGVSHQQYFSSGTWTAKAHHRLCVAKDVVLHGVVRCGKKFTFPLIPPSLEPDDPLATPSNSICLAIENDRVLSEKCDAIVHELTKSVRNDMCRTLVTDLANKDASFKGFPFIEYIEPAAAFSPFVLPQSGCYGINDLVILPITICIMLTNTLMVSHSSATLIQSWNTVQPAYVQNNPRNPLVPIPLGLPTNPSRVCRSTFRLLVLGPRMRNARRIALD
jgi:hypothetical protein